MLEGELRIAECSSSLTWLVVLADIRAWRQAIVLLLFCHLKGIGVTPLTCLIPSEGWAYIYITREQ